MSKPIRTHKQEGVSGAPVFCGNMNAIQASPNWPEVTCGACLWKKKRQEERDRKRATSATPR